LENLINNGYGVYVVFEYRKLGGLTNGGVYPGGLIRGIKKKRFEMSHSSVDGNTFLICQFLIDI